MAQAVCILHTKANNYLQNTLMWLTKLIQQNLEPGCVSTQRISQY